MKRLLIIAILSLLYVPVEAITDTTFVTTYGGLRYEEGNSMAITFDKGFIMVGSTGSFGLGNSDVYIVKTDSIGTVEWTRSYGGVNTDVGMDVKQTVDSGYIITGFTNSFGAGGYDVLMLRINSSGDSLWLKTIGGADWDMGYSVVQTSLGGFAVAGETFSYGAGDNDAYLIKTDANGVVMWTQTYGGVEQDFARCLIETVDSGFVIAGGTHTFDVDSGDIYLIKTNELGDTLWTNHYGGTRMDYANGIIETLDTCYAFIGTTESYLSKNKFVYFGKCDSEGTQLWFNPLGSIEGEEEGMDLIQMTSKRYALLGYGDFNGAGAEDFYLIITNEAGGFIIGPSVGYQGSEIAHSISLQSNGGVAMFGTTNSIGAGLTEMILITRDSLGNDYTGFPIPGPPLYTSYFDTTIAEAPVYIGSTPNATVKVSVYPNPMIKDVTINISGISLLNKSVHFRLYDLTGRIISSVEITQHLPYRFHNSGLLAGIYLYEIAIQDGQMKKSRDIYKGKLIVTAE